MLSQLVNDIPLGLSSQGASQHSSQSFKPSRKWHLFDEFSRTIRGHSFPETPVLRWRKVRRPRFQRRLRRTHFRTWLTEIRFLSLRPVPARGMRRASVSLAPKASRNLLIVSTAAIYFQVAAGNSKILCKFSDMSISICNDFYKFNSSLLSKPSFLSCLTQHYIEINIQKNI